MVRPAYKGIERMEGPGHAKRRRELPTKPMPRFLLHGSGAINGPCRTVVRDWVLGYRRVMNAVTALDKHIEGYRRQMTGEQRLTVALELHELSCDVAREAIRQANPEADATEVERLLHRRLELARAE